MQQPIRQNTRVHYDTCHRQSEVHTDQFIEKRQLNQDLPNAMHRSRYLNLIGNEVGLYPESMDGYRSNIDNYSALINGRQGGVITSDKTKANKIMQTRTFIGVPFVGEGQSTMRHPDVKSRLMMGELTHQRKTVSGLSGITIDRFEPLVPHVANNIQDSRHIIQEWARGGVATNVIVRNIDHIKSCGYI